MARRDGSPKSICPRQIRTAACECLYFYDHVNQKFWSNRVGIVKERTCFCSTLWPKSQRMVEAYEILQSDKSFVRLLLTSSIGLLRRIAATIQRGTWRRKSMLVLARATFMASVA